MSGIKYVAALLRSPEGLAAFFKMGTPPQLLKTKKEQELGQYVTQHVQTYGKLPAESTLAEAVGYKLPAEVVEPPAFYFDGMIRAHVHLELKRHALSIAESLNLAADPLVCLDKARSELIELWISNNSGQVVNYAKEGAELIKKEFDKKLALGDDYGLMLGWPTFDNMAGGLVGGDVVSCIGRPAVGKTFMLLHVALNSWKKMGGVPLFISMEMKPVQLLQRLAAMDTITSISELKKAQLSKAKLKQMMAHLRKNEKKQDYWIVDGALMTSIDDIVTYCRQFKPSALYVDGAYLVRASNPRAQKWERVGEVAERLKGDIAEKLGIPVIASYQFNRGATKLKKDEKAGLEHIAYADTVGQVSSVVLGLTEEDSIETKTRRRIDILKGRSGEVGEFYIRWEFSQFPMMDFSEISETTLEDLNSL